MTNLLRDRRRWLIAGLLFFISTIAFLDRQTLSILEKTLEKALGFSATEYSDMVTGFLIATGAGYLFAGRLRSSDQFCNRVDCVVHCGGRTFAGRGMGLAHFLAHHFGFG